MSIFRPAVLGACFACLMLAGNTLAQDESSIVGVWVNGDGDGWIELEIVGSELIGRILGSPADPLNRNPSRLDIQNPEESLRDRPLRGLTILSGFRYEGDGRWDGGRVYDPNSGNTYKGTITVVDDVTLKLRGFIGISLFGRTEVWVRRVENKSM
jgi:uncharacterized protein (DUF2147 family)